MRKLFYIAIAVIASSLIYAVGYNSGEKYGESKTSAVTVDSTMTTEVRVIRDTVYESVPVPVVSSVTRTDTVWLSSVSTNDKTTSDSIKVELPIVQNEYETSEYHAWVSGGYYSSLDSIMVFPETTVVTNTIERTVTQKQMKRWNLGVQAGYGYTGTKLQPYIGIGISYAILGW